MGRTPGPGDDVERLIEALFRFLDRDAEAAEFGIAVALADTEIEPSTRQEIEGRRLLSEQHRIVPRQHDHRTSDP